MSEQKKRSGVSRREFIKIGGVTAVGIATGIIWLENGVAAIPASTGYLLVDTKKCSACLNCMVMCSIAHEGKANLSLARIQVLQDSFLHFPDDVTVEPCRQCLSPACVKACQTGALFIDSKNGNVRRVNAEKCIGCKACVRACPYTPSRVVWNFEDKHAQMCDLCADTPFWNEKGGADGKQACIKVCAYGAIKFTQKIPMQQGEVGYKVI